MKERLDGGGWNSIDADSWPTEEDALALWAYARNRLRFHRRLSRAKKGNKRLHYLLGVAVCRRVAHLFPDPRCQRAVRTAEAYAEGTATVRSLEAAYNAAGAVTESGRPAAVVAAVRAAHWCSCPDDYHLIQVVEYVVDAAGYLASVAAGALAPDGGAGPGRDVWNHPTFVAGKRDEHRALGPLIRDVLGNPFRPVKFLLSWRTPGAVAIAQEVYEGNDFSSLPVLGDALEESGCTDEQVLSHCRAAGPHVRGCWVVDGVLGKK